MEVSEAVFVHDCAQEGEPPVAEGKWAVHAAGMIDAGVEVAAPRISPGVVVPEPSVWQKDLRAAGIENKARR